jgi:ferredoxin
MTDPHPHDRLPRWAAALDGLANRLYGSRFNPLYQAGTIAVVLLVVLLITGLWLLLFYRIGAPWASVAALTEAPWTGNWVRGLHRYASDGAIVAAVVHLGRMFLQRRSYGPRVLAWLSGVGLLGLLFVCGWTGFVLVWDTFGEKLAVEGARIIDALPILSEPLERTFTGERPIPSAFFFVNLFLHVALPLGLGLGLWLHVSRVSRPVLLPPRSLWVGVVLLLTAIAIVRPLAMAPEADPFRRAASIPVDWFYAFWLPLHASLPPWGAWAGVAVLVGGLVSVPWLTRRPKARSEASRVDSRLCTGCEQCAHDCPYEAITMVGRSDGRAKLVARVDSDRCVSCAICAGSCDVSAVGPPGRNGRDQAAWATTRFAPADVTGRLVILACEHAARPEVGADSAVHATVRCVGSVHASVIGQALTAGARGIVIVGCPPRDCWHREGPRWATERMAGRQEARWPSTTSDPRVRLVDGSDSVSLREAIQSLEAEAGDAAAGQ